MPHGGGPANRVKLATVFTGNTQRGSEPSAPYTRFSMRDGACSRCSKAKRSRPAAPPEPRHTPRTGSPARMRGISCWSDQGRIACRLAEAHRFVRPIDRVSVWSRTLGRRAATLPRPTSKRDGMEAVAIVDLERAVREADIVSCATLSTTPWSRRMARARSDLDLVGAFHADMRETDDAAMARADLVVVDQRTAALAEGGDIVQALRAEALPKGRHRGRSRRPRARPPPGRTRGDKVTVFKSVGFALEDLAAAEAVFDRGGGRNRCMTSAH